MAMVPKEPSDIVPYGGGWWERRQINATNRGVEQFERLRGRRSQRRLREAHELMRTAVRMDVRLDADIQEQLDYNPSPRLESLLERRYRQWDGLSGLIIEDFGYGDG